MFVFYLNTIIQINFKINIKIKIDIALFKFSKN